MSRAKPLRGAEGALDILIFSEQGATVAIDGVLHRGFAFDWFKFSGNPFWRKWGAALICGRFQRSAFTKQT